MRRSSLLLLLAAAACSGGRASAPPPAAEFLIAAGDSTYWVRSGPTGVRLRGSPLALARDGSRFYELYVADDDHSFYDALFVGQRIYRRDVVTGDSTLVFDDSTVARLARRYARRHPGAEPLGPNDEASENPHTVATGEVEILSVHGPYVSYEYHADVDVVDEDELHSTRRGVIDLRSGERATVATIFGDEGGTLVVGRGRRAYQATLDSVRARRDVRARRAAAALGSFAFDERSFGLVEIGREPGVGFLVPGTGQRGGGLALPLPAVPAPAPPWWGQVRELLPEGTPDSTRDRWRRGAYEVVAAYDSIGDTFRLLLHDGRRSWSVGRLPGPAHHIFWLDSAVVDSTVRQGLARAFDESAFYSDQVRSVRGSGSRGRVRVRFAAVTAGTSVNMPALQSPRRHPVAGRRAIGDRRSGPAGAVLIADRRSPAGLPFPPVVHADPSLPSALSRPSPQCPTSHRKPPATPRPSSPT
jgi:hypothetical protein